MSKFGVFNAETPEELATYYGGFYPTEAWIDALTCLPPGSTPDPLSAHSDTDVNALRKYIEPYLNVTPEDLVDLVPKRNRIAGNARVMPAARIAMCPDGHGEKLTWRPDHPDRISCPHGHTVDPFERYPQTGAFEITGPLGDLQIYPYHDTSDGTRIYLQSEYMDALRVYWLTDACKTLGELYSCTGEIPYAERAAAILTSFARSVPHWPKIHRGRPGVSGADRFCSVTEYPVYAGIWYDKYHTGIRHTGMLGAAYGQILHAPVWQPLDAFANNDARNTIEQHLFLYSIKDALRYDVHYPHPDAALSNYIPYQCEGLIQIGKAIRTPELIHYAYWKLRQMLDKTLLADAIFPESMSYSRQHIYGIRRAAEYATGYSDPPGFTSTIDHTRFETLDAATALPELDRAIRTLDTMGYPDGTYIMAHDTYSKLHGGGHPEPRDGQPVLYPAFGHAVLGRGQNPNALQAHLHYSGNWGHDHDDMLNFVLWAYCDELISDIGYTWTYRMFATLSQGHNLVVVDRHTQQRTLRPGTLLGWHPTPNRTQVVEVSAPEVYPQCDTYCRALILIPIDPKNNLVLDIFHVSGGQVHEWMAQGSCSLPQTLDTSVPTQHHADSYADNGEPFTPPDHHEWEKNCLASGHIAREVDTPWYGVFRNVRHASIQAPFTATFHATDPAQPNVRLHLLEPGEADLYTCTVPTIRQCWQPALDKEDHSLVEQSRMPKLILRRKGHNLSSRFVALWEPLHTTPIVTDIADRSADLPNLVARTLQTHTETGDTTAHVFYSSDPSQHHTLDPQTEFQGRYAVQITRNGQTNLDLYDCTRFRHNNLDLSITLRSALPLNKLHLRPDNRIALVLDGTWPDIDPDRPRTFSEPEPVLLTQNGAHGRAIPVTAIETHNNQTHLVCAHAPGFTYNRSTGCLVDTVSPFQTTLGEATVNLFSRVHLRMDSSGKAQIRTTDVVRINNVNIVPVEEWVEVG
ncbi:MAG: heparinase II/III family protein [bacterium]|nr:heparinase II/III family protein [bacterium]